MTDVIFQERLVQNWARCLDKSETQKRNSGSGCDTTWSDVYHKLIHSPALEALLQLEHRYAIVDGISIPAFFHRNAGGWGSPKKGGLK